MPTISQEISKIRTSIKAFTDDSPYSDEFLYAKLIDMRNKHIYRRLEKNKLISSENYTSFCVGLELTKYHNCECIAHGCDILKTRYKIPAPLSANGKLLLNVRTVDGVKLNMVTPDQQITNKYSHTLASKVAYYYEPGQNHIVIWNRTSFQAIYVEGVFYDPTEASTLTTCDPSCGDDVVDSCAFDPSIDEFPMDGSLSAIVHEDLFRELVNSKRIQEDVSNNSEDVT